MNKSSGNLQDLFLNYVRKENIPVTIYLVNSVQLRGSVRGFDPFTILLETPGRPMQMVYKSAVTSIVPMRPVYMRGADSNPRQEGEREDETVNLSGSEKGDSTNTVNTNSVNTASVNTANINTTNEAPSNSNGS